MRHPTDGTLRRLVDEPAGVPDADRRHVAECPACLDGLAAARADATAAAAVLSTEAAPDVDRAWQRLSATVAADGRRRVPEAAPRRRRAWLRSPAVAGLGVVLVLAGGGAAAAADWLQVFRTERVDPIEISSTELVQVPDLSAYGDLQLTQEPDTEPVADAATARERTGLDVPEVGDLPEGVTGEPSYMVADVVGATFTFSAEKAAQAAAAEGEALPPLPAGLDGSSLRLEAGPGVATVWTQPTGVPTLVVANVVAPEVFSSGVPFETVRDYLLSLPGLPPGLADQLRDLSADAATLPLPVPADMVTSSTADVDGVPATVLTSKDGLFAGVVWVEDGVMTGVGGSLSADELLSVARGLR
jgi:hypothetical protein